MIFMRANYITIRVGILLIAVLRRLFHFAYTIILLAIFAMAACGNSIKEEPSSQLLIVERQQMEVGNSPFGKEKFSIDIPLSGPIILKDSVMSFLNEQLYLFCEDQVDGSGKSPDSMLITDAEWLLRHYVDVYRPLAQKKGGWLPSLYITMLAQTESFITYGVTFYHNKSVYGSEMYCYTFSKQDGHRLREIFSYEKLDNFFEKRRVQIWGYKPKIEITQNLFGLNEDSLLFAVNGLDYGFLLEEFGYSEILPYLSEEAKLLISQKGSRDSYPRNSWYMGRRIGTVSTNEGDTIFLMEQDTTLVLPKQKRGGSRDVKLLTCTRKNGQYFPLLGFKTTKGKTSSVGYNIYDDRLFMKEYSSYNSYDKDKRELYVVYFKDRETIVRRIYQFDGHFFVDTHKEELWGKIIYD